MLRPPSTTCLIADSRNAGVYFRSVPTFITYLHKVKLTHLVASVFWGPDQTIESTFASVRLRTAKTRGCGSRTSILSMVFKLTMSAEQRWLKLRGAERITEVIQGVKFKNGVREQPNQIAA